MKTIRLTRPTYGHVIEVFSIALKGRDLTGSVYPTRDRPSGRRILVRERGEVVYDTDDCYDVANAANKLDHWLNDQLPCDVCGKPNMGEGQRTADTVLCRECIPAK